MERKIMKIGGSYVVAIPKVMRKMLGLRMGDKVKLVADQEAIMMIKVKREEVKIWKIT